MLMVMMSTALKVDHRFRHRRRRHRCCGRCPSRPPHRHHVHHLHHHRDDNDIIMNRLLGLCDKRRRTRIYLVCIYIYISCCAVVVCMGIGVVRRVWCGGTKPNHCVSSVCVSFRLVGLTD